jgi:hypothetical protein
LTKGIYFKMPFLEKKQSSTSCWQNAMPFL